MSGQVHIDVVSAVDTANQNIVVIQALGVLLSNQTSDLGAVDTLNDPVQDGLVDQRVLSQNGLVGLNEGLFQLDQGENINGLHHQQELFLGHHLTIGAETVVDIAGLVAPGLGNSSQIIGSLVADVDLVGPVTQNGVPVTQVAGQLLQVLGFGIDDTLGCLGGTVVQHHIRGMSQDITCALDYGFHGKSSSLKKFYCVF